MYTPGIIVEVQPSCWETAGFLMNSCANCIDGFKMDIDTTSAWLDAFQTPPEEKVFREKIVDHWSEANQRIILDTTRVLPSQIMSLCDLFNPGAITVDESSWPKLEPLWHAHQSKMMVLGTYRGDNVVSITEGFIYGGVDGVICNDIIDAFAVRDAFSESFLIICRLDGETISRREMIRAAVSHRVVDCFMIGDHIPATCGSTFTRLTRDIAFGSVRGKKWLR